MIRPGLDDLHTFLAVSDARGFGKAAELLGLSQPAVSYRIRKLEEQLGTPVFEEPRRRVILTPAGRSLREVCQRMLSELDAVVERISSGRLSRGPLRMACPGAFGRNVVFPALERAELGDVTVELLFRPLEQIFDLVESGGVDLGIAYGTRATNTLEFRQVAREEFSLITPSDAPLPDDATLDQVVARTFVTYEECDYVFGTWFSAVFGRRPARMRTGSAFSRVEEVVATVRRGRGCSIVPLHAIRPGGDPGGRPSAGAAAEGLAVWRPEGRPRCYNPEYAVTRPGWQSGPEVEALLDALGRSEDR